MLKAFYIKTHYFWVISRFILILLFTIAIINTLKDLSKITLLTCGFCLTITISMLWIGIMEIRKKKSSMPIKVMTGGFAIFFGLLLLFLIITFGGADYNFGTKFGFSLVPLWIIFYGLWEIKTA